MPNPLQCVASAFPYGEQRMDSAPCDFRDDGPDPVRPVPQEHFGSASRRASRANAGRDCVEHLQRLYRVRLVGRSGANHQRDAVRVGHNVAFAAISTAIRGVRDGVRPPLNARTDALSITTRSRWIWPCRPSTSKSRWCRWGQIPSCVHKWNRRQHVEPLPCPKRVVSVCLGMPLLSTDMIPSRQSRFGMRGRPPFGEGSGSGRSDAIPFHKASVTSFFAISFSSAIVRPVLKSASSINTSNDR